MNQLLWKIFRLSGQTWAQLWGSAWWVYNLSPVYKRFEVLTCNQMKHNGFNWVLLWIFGFSCTAHLKGRPESGEANWRNYPLRASRGKPDSFTQSDSKLKAWLYGLLWFLYSVQLPVLCSRRRIWERQVCNAKHLQGGLERRCLHTNLETVWVVMPFFPFFEFPCLPPFLPSQHSFTQTVLCKQSSLFLTVMYPRTYRTDLVVFLPDGKEILG